MQVYDFTIHEIFLLQDFRDWWREKNSKDPANFKVDNTPETWEKMFALYRKYRLAAEGNQHVANS